jgi:hypothetical protein
MGLVHEADRGGPIAHLIWEGVRAVLTAAHRMGQSSHPTILTFLPEPLLHSSMDKVDC